MRSALPFLWADKSCQSPNAAAWCELYLNGECPHGISGRLNGACERLHPKRCNKYMKWGKRHDKGCKSTSCDKAHPVLCDRSHDLKCLAPNCPFKLHTQKCVRIDQQQGRGVNNNSSSHRNSGGGQYYGRVWDTRHGPEVYTPLPHPWTTSTGRSPDHTGRSQGSVVHTPAASQGSASRQVHNSGFQGLTVQQLLEAHFQAVQQELARQRQEHNLMQFRIQQQLLGGRQVGQGPVWADRPLS